MKALLIALLLLCAGCVSYQHEVDTPASQSPQGLVYETYRFRLTFFGMFDWYDYISSSSHTIQETRWSALHER